MTANALDPLDEQLIELLSHDARVSNRKIAAELGVTEGTVRARIKRLQEEGKIAFTAITDLGLSKRDKLAFINVQVDVGRVREIADQISRIPTINAVLVVMGPFNIVAICLFDELEHVAALASDTILSIDGVHHVESSIAVKTFKYNARMAKITGPHRPAAED